MAVTKYWDSATSSWKTAGTINANIYVGDTAPTDPTIKTWLDTSADGYNPEDLNKNIVRPNLLDNGWFTVNQRAVSAFTVGAYGADRWKLVSGTATVSDNKITLNGTLRQILENSIGSSFTASVLCESGTATVSYDDTTKYFDIVSSGGVIKAVKLELGSFSTLANDTAPNYAEELLKCQRYYQRFIAPKSYTMFGNFGIALSATSFRTALVLVTEMRDVPSVAFSSGLLGISTLDGYGTQESSVSAMSVHALLSGKDQVVIDCTVTGLTSGATYILRSNNSTNSYIEFSADL